MRGIISNMFRGDVSQDASGQVLIAGNCVDAGHVPATPCFGWVAGESILCPPLETIFDELSQADTLLLTDANKALGKPGAVRCFHLASNLVIALFRGLADQLALPMNLYQ